MLYNKLQEELNLASQKKDEEIIEALMYVLNLVDKYLYLRSDKEVLYAINKVFYTYSEETVPKVRAIEYLKNLIESEKPSKLKMYYVLEENDIKNFIEAIAFLDTKYPGRYEPQDVQYFYKR